MKMRLLILVFLTGITCVQGTKESVSISHGSLIEELGQIKLIDHIVVIKKNLTELEKCQGYARSMLESVNNILKKENDTENIQLLSQAEENLLELISSRTKRSLLPFVGNALNSLFGVATEADLEKEKERLDKIENWANNYGHVITDIIDNANKNAQKFNILIEEVKDLENNVEQEINHLERKLAIQNVVNEIFVKINHILSWVESIRKAHYGIVDVNLITMSELQQIIQKAVLEFHFQPLAVDLITLYNLLTVKIVGNMCFIFLPFDNNEVFKATKVMPFPMMIHEQPVKLMGDENLVLQNKLNLVSMWKVSDLQEFCLQIKTNEYICNYPHFYLQPMNPCINFLFNGGNDLCNYVHFEEDFYVKFLEEIYVFVKSEMSAEVNCVNHHEKLILRNVKVLPGNCKITINNKFYYNPPVFKVINTTKTIDLVNTDFELKLKEFKIHHNNVKMTTLPPYQNPFMVLYRQTVMPWMTMLYIPALLFTIFAVYFAIKLIIFRKMKNMNNMLQKHLDNAE